MRLVRPAGKFAVIAAVALAIVTAPCFLGARHQDTEQELLARIARENNAPKKARLQAELATLKLDQAAAAFDHDQYDSGKSLLQQYTGWIRKAWNLLEQSGRDATRKPQGFKYLDITLRENARALADLAERTPYEDRGPIEATAKTADEVHSQVIAALFPDGVKEEGGPPSPPGKDAETPSSGPGHGKPAPGSSLVVGGPHP
jgi:hypothetical protein